jgi:hypothetical protein
MKVMASIQPSRSTSKSEKLTTGSTRLNADLRASCIVDVRLDRAEEDDAIHCEKLAGGVFLLIRTAIAAVFLDPHVP